MPPKKESTGATRKAKAAPKKAIELTKAKEEPSGGQGKCAFRSNCRDEKLEDAVITYVKTMSDRTIDLLELVNTTETFTPPSYPDFIKPVEELEKDFTAIPKTGRLGEICVSIGRWIGQYLKDVDSAKMLLAVIFSSFHVDKDVKLGHDELKESVLKELDSLDQSIRENADMWEEYHKYRAKHALESKINPGCEDLKIALWVLEWEVSCQSQSTLLQMIMGYYGLMETVRETYDLLQMPGTIGHRRTHIKVLRNNLYG